MAMKRVKYRSKNRYREFLRAARTVARKISGIDGVVGILATGGMGRGHCDDYSDLDVVVYADDKKVKELDSYIAVGYLRHHGLWLDTPVLSYDKAMRHRSPGPHWPQMIRWDHQNSQILFDPRGRIRELLQAKLVFPDWEQRKLLKEYSRELTDGLVYGYELWCERGAAHNLAHELIQNATFLILWIYANRKCFAPYVPKWLFYHLENGFIPEARYLPILKRAYTGPIRNLTDARRIRDDLLGLCEKLGVDLYYRSIEELADRSDRNWEKASERTRHYLSW
jgi:hypothetical protein